MIKTNQSTAVCVIYFIVIFTHELAVLYARGVRVAAVTSGPA